MRFAVTLNFVVPGAGQFYLGQRLFGSLVAVVFCACFGAILVLFVMGYAEYLGLAMSGDLAQMEKAGDMGALFHTRWLVGLAVGAVLIYLGSFVSLALGPRRS